MIIKTAADAVKFFSQFDGDTKITVSDRYIAVANDMGLNPTQIMIQSAINMSEAVELDA